MYEIYDNRTWDSMIWQHVPSADCKSRSTVSIGRWVLVEWVIPLLPLYWLDIPVFSGLCVTNVLAPFFDCLNRLYFVGIFHCLVWTPADIWKKKKILQNDCCIMLSVCPQVIIKETSVRREWVEINVGMYVCEQMCMMLYREYSNCSQW